MDMPAIFFGQITKEFNSTDSIGILIIILRKVTISKEQ